MALRRADVDGRYERTITLSIPGVATPFVTSLRALDDGSLLVGGFGDPGWIAKLSPTGALDPAFGTNGVALPRPGVNGYVRVIGVRSDGRIAIEFEPWQISSADPRALGLLHADGSLDTTYAPAGQGFIGLFGLVVLPTANMPDPVASTAAPFLDTDGSILCAVASVHSFASDPFVRFGLRRITPGGDYDPAFGLGVPSVAAPAPGTQIILSLPAGTTSSREAYTFVAAVGCAWMGGRLYVVAAGTAGGVVEELDTSPAYGVLLVSRWHPDGTHDNAFGVGGVQEAGFDPDRIEFTPAGVIPLSGTELLVYGQAGRLETQTHTVGSMSYTVTTIRRQEPAIFRILDPGGIDTAFGGTGAEVFPVQEFRAAITAARLLPPAVRRGGERFRFTCADNQTQDIEPKDPTSTFGGIGQATFPRPWPPHPIL